MACSCLAFVRQEPNSNSGCCALFDSLVPRAKQPCSRLLLPLAALQGIGPPQTCLKHSKETPKSKMADTKSDRTVVSRAVRNAREFVSYSDGASYTRKLDRATNQPIGDWTAVEAPVDDKTTPSEPSTRYLSVVAEHQAENEPKHWFLFSHVPNAMGIGPGQV
jgi:hypothetical protein